MKKTITKISTVFLALVMLFSSVAPTTAYAAVPKKTNITSISVRDQKVTLKWKKVSNAKKYQIQYSTSSKFKNAKTANASGRSKTVGNLKPSKTYYFRVRGVRGKRKGKWSAKRKIKTKTAKPTTPVITGIKAGSNYLTVSWSKSKRVSGYQLQYSTSNKFKNATTLNVSKKSNTRKITGLKKNKRYYVRVRAYHNYQKKTYRSGWSGASNKKTNSNGGNSTVTSYQVLIPNKIRVDNNGDYSIYISEPITYCGLKVSKGWHYYDKEVATNMSINSDYSVLYCEDIPVLFSSLPDGEDDLGDRYSYSSNAYYHTNSSNSDVRNNAKAITKGINNYCKDLYLAYKKIDMPNNANDYEKIMILTKWFNQNYRYDYTYSYGTGYDLVHGKKAVCQGFAQLLKDFCWLYDIPCHLVNGKLLKDDKASHQWNIVELNGYWYQIDTTGNDVCSGGSWADVPDKLIKFKNGLSDMTDADVMIAKVNEEAYKNNNASWGSLYCYPTYETWDYAQTSMGNSVSESDKELHKHDYYITYLPIDSKKNQAKRTLVSVTDDLRLNVYKSNASYAFISNDSKTDYIMKGGADNYKKCRKGYATTLENDYKAVYSAAINAYNHNFK